MSRRRLAGLLLAIMVVSGCDTSNYAFKIDTSIKVVAPRARSDVSIPVRIAWTDSEPPANLRLDPTDPAATYYAVFLDTAPLGPGKRLATLVEHSNQCRLSEGCPTAQQLADAGVHLSAQPSVLLDFVADRRPSSHGDTKDTHEVTIVRMRGDKRVGETAFRRTFFVAR
jgi:hypothetical protein